MALETLKEVNEIGGFKIVDVCKEREEFAKRHPTAQRQDGVSFNVESWDKYFERVVRKESFIYVRHDVNSLSFTIQNGPIKENGINGCQIDTLIEAAKIILEALNKKFPSEYNTHAISHLGCALLFLENRKKDREIRGVEGQNKA